MKAIFGGALSVRVRVLPIPRAAMCVCVCARVLVCLRVLYFRVEWLYTMLSVRAKVFVCKYVLVGDWVAVGVRPFHAQP